MGREKTNAILSLKNKATEKSNVDSSPLTWLTYSQLLSMYNLYTVQVKVYDICHLSGYWVICHTVCYSSDLNLAHLPYAYFDCLSVATR